MTTVGTRSRLLDSNRGSSRPSFVLSSRAMWLSACLLGVALPWACEGPRDQQMFAHLGDQMLQLRLGSVYASADNQAGPLQLLVASLTVHSGALVGSQRVVWSVLSVVLVAVVWACVRRRGGVDPTTQGAIALTAVLWCGPGGLWDGHPAEALIASGWVAAAVMTSRGRSLVAGVLVGLTTAVAPWGLLGVPVLLLGSRRDAPRSIAVGLAVSVMAYAPFVATGNFALTRFRWTVAPDSLAHLIRPDLVYFGWADRLGQAAFVEGVAVVVALRSKAVGVVLVPLSVAVVRVLTDPVGLDYYLVPVGLLALLVPLIARPEGRRVNASSLAILYVPVLGSALVATVPYVALWCGVVMLALIAVRLRKPRPKSVPRNRSRCAATA